MLIRNLRLGSKGPDVKAVQDALNYRRRCDDPRLVPDGDFGRHTRDAVVAFQKRFDLDPDGIVGYYTRKALFPLLGFTTYLHVTRSKGDYPVGRAASRGEAAFTARPRDLKIEGFGADGLKAKGIAGGDVPDSDPSPIVPFLPPLTDPYFAPMKPLNLSGFSIPVPSLPETLFGLSKDQSQVQAGGQFTTRHLWESKPGSSNPSLAAVFSLQQIYARNKDQDGHPELAFGVQVLDTVLAQSPDGTGWVISPFVQFTWADPFWHRGRFHLVAPFAQITAQSDPKLKDPAFGIGLFPVNITMDINERLSVIGQAGFVGLWDVGNKRGEIGTQAAVVGSWAF